MDGWINIHEINIHPSTQVLEELPWEAQDTVSGDGKMWHPSYFLSPNRR